MGTKLNPGRFDCYAKLQPHEPHFVLMGRDRQSGYLIREWADNYRRLNEAEGTYTPDKKAKFEEAYKCADDCDAHCRALGKEPRFMGA